ncbi:MAG: 3-dehydroquinate synthase [Flavobacteriales bacterium]|nr:3-dehydroquinate synthase [Flavobacteriales bacterium]
MSVVDNQRIKSDGHEIVIGRHSLAEFAEILSTDAFAGVKLFILVDENTLEYCLPILVSKVPPLRDAEVLEVAPGEESKSLEISEQLWAVLGEMNADRSSVLVNLGGGVVSDLGGFIAGTFKRGIRFFNVPTSLLAQVDASAGGKVGVNLNGLKNEIGLFKNPHRVYIDPEFLKTLPKEHLLSGFSEMIKHALICDAAYWKSLQEISFYKLKTLDSAILKSVRIKTEIVSSDPFENGRRKILNFGHTWPREWLWKPLYRTKKNRLPPMSSTK